MHPRPSSALLPAAVAAASLSLLSAWTAPAAAQDEPTVVTSPAVRQLVAPALGDDPESHLVFVPIPPCRLVDTRLPGPLTGPLLPNQIRSFVIAQSPNFAFPQQGGKSGGCGVPRGEGTPLAPAVVVNLVAVAPGGPGHLLAWEVGQPAPEASVINYANVPGLNIANGVVLPIRGTKPNLPDLNVVAGVSATHLIVDVTGYFTRFPAEQIAAGEKSIIVRADGGPVDMSNSGQFGVNPDVCPQPDVPCCPPGKTCCYPVNSCTVTSTVPGKVIVRTWAQVQMRVEPGDNVSGNRLIIGNLLGTVGPSSCIDHSVNNSDFELPHSHGVDDNVMSVLNNKRIFDHSGTRTYSMFGKMVTGAGAGDGALSSRMICTFIPN